MEANQLLTIQFCQKHLLCACVHVYVHVHNQIQPGRGEREYSCQAYMVRIAELQLTLAWV